jgi:hypothetical protein
MENLLQGGIAMSRHMLSLSQEHLTAYDLDAFVTQAAVLKQHHRDTFTTPFPKASSRWLSHYAFAPQPIQLTPTGDVEGGLSWLVGATIDFSFTRAICAPHYGVRGGPCYDPASLVVLEVAAKVDQYVDYACSKRTRGIVIGNWPASTTPSPARMTSVTSATASAPRPLSRQ